jgi:hypothetical protein
MRTFPRIGLTLMLAAVLLLSMVGAVANARGVTAQQMADAGWECMVAGPHGWTHCTPPGNGLFTGESLPATAQVKVFEGWDGEFLGTEILVRWDVYENGMQPCPTDGGGPYHFLGMPPYYACHHFDTSH